MRVTNAAWEGPADAERAAERYRRHGYDTKVCEVRSVPDGQLQMLWLDCQPRAQ